MGGRVNKGFTLIEILISITILSIVILIIGGALRLGISSVDRGKAEVEKIDRLRSLVLLLDRQISSAVQTTHTVNGENIVWFTGDNKGCSFLSTSSLWGRREGLIEITYAVEEGDREDFRITETERLPGEKDGLRLTIFPDLKDAEFAYFTYDTDGNPQWLKDWTEKDKFPVAIALRIKGKALDHNLIFPLMSKGIMKQQQPASISNKEELGRRLLPFR